MAANKALGSGMKRLFFTALLLTASCASSAVYDQIPVASFRNFGGTPLNHTVYVGSDALFHYFVWENGKSSGRWKVPKGEMPFKTEWSVGTRDALLTKDASGKWQPYIGGS